MNWLINSAYSEFPFVFLGVCYLGGAVLVFPPLQGNLNPPNILFYFLNLKAKFNSKE